MSDRSGWQGRSLPVSPLVRRACGPAERRPLPGGCLAFSGSVSFLPRAGFLLRIGSSENRFPVFGPMRQPALLAGQETLPQPPGAALGRFAALAVPARPPPGQGSPSGRERRGPNRRRPP
jgi:hypothetical protein